MFVNKNSYNEFGARIELVPYTPQFIQRLFFFWALNLEKEKSQA
jgi:hypothetical protein